MREQPSTFYFLLSTVLESKFQHGETDADEESHQQDPASSEVVFELQKIVSDDKNARNDAQQYQFLDQVEVEYIQRFSSDSQYQIDKSVKDTESKGRNEDSQ